MIKDLWMKRAIEMPVSYVNSTNAGPTATRTDHLYKGVHSQQTALYLCIPDEQSKGHPERKKRPTNSPLFFFPSAILPDFDQIRKSIL
jgi:hypothetical protein